MKITREGYGAPIGLVGDLGGTDPTDPEGTTPGPDCCDPDPDLPDRGSGDGGAIASALSEGTLAFVQKKTNANANTDADITVTLDAPASAGNLLIATYTARTGNPTVAAATPAGWTRYPNEFSGDDPDNGTACIFLKTAVGGETGLTITKGESVYAHLVVSEYSGNLTLDVSDFADEIAAATSLVTDAITPTGSDVLLYASFNQSARTATYTWGGSFTELADANVFTSGPSATSGYRLVTGASGSYAASVTSTESDSYGWAILAFTATGAAWALRADAVNDGDDATYYTVTGTDLIRLDLGAPHRIVRTRIRIAGTTAGARVITIKGANAVDFSDEVTLATIPFTATGSLTAQDVEATWPNTASYRYYELDIGTSDTYRIHAWELYEGTLATDISGHVDATDDAHDAGAIAYDNSGSGLTSDNVQDAIDELAGGAGSDTTTPIDHGSLGSTETIDASAGAWHRGVLDDDVAITVSGFTIDEALVVIVGLTQDGSGGHAITWDGDVVFAGDDQPGQAAGDVTWYALWSDEGDATVYGAIIGGGATIAALDDIPDVNAPSPSDGDVLTWDSTPGEWVPAAPTAVGDLDDLSDVAITTPAENDTLRYVSGQWINDARRWEPVTFDFGSGPELVWDAGELVMEWKEY